MASSQSLFRWVRSQARGVHGQAKIVGAVQYAKEGSTRRGCDRLKTCGYLLELRWHLDVDPKSRNKAVSMHATQWHYLKIATWSSVTLVKNTSLIFHSGVFFF